MKLYISGPMRGYAYTNFPAFDHVRDSLLSWGHEVFSPADNDRKVWPEIEKQPGFATGAHVNEWAPEGFTFPELFVWDVWAIGQADGIVLIDGWEQSQGAQLELAVAKAFEKQVFLWDVNRIVPEGHFTPEIIGLMGYAQAGKDTLAQELVRQGFVRVSFADTLRECLYALNPIITGTDGFARLQGQVDKFGWDYMKAHFTEVRELLQRLGTEVGRNILGQNIWVDTAMEKVGPGGRYVFTDVRFPNEAEAIKAAGGELWRVVRDGYGPVNDHPSETAVDHIVADHTIYNNLTIEDLHAKVSP